MQLFIEKLSLQSDDQESGFLMNQHRTCYNGVYPYKIFPKKGMKEVVFSPITIFYFTNDELNYAQVKALALSEPLMKEYVEKENALRNARLVLRQEIMQKESAKLEIKRVKEEQESLALRRERTTQNLEYVENNIVNLRVCFSSIAELITSQLEAFSPDREITKIGEFSLCFPHTQSEKKQFLVLERLNTEYYVEFGDSVSGNKTRLSNFFEKFNNQVSNLKKRYEELEEKKENLKNQIQYCSGIEKKIEKLEEEKQAIFDKISIKKVD